MTSTKDDECKIAFEKFLEEKSLHNTKDKDIWGQEIYKHAHIDCMWYAWQSCWNTRPAKTTGAVPDGWVLVPNEPTREMIEAVKKADWWGDGRIVFGCEVAYKAMIAAAPQNNPATSDAADGSGTNAAMSLHADPDDDQVRGDILTSSEAARSHEYDTSKYTLTDDPVRLTLKQHLDRLGHKVDIEKLRQLLFCYDDITDDDNEVIQAARAHLEMMEKAK